MNISVFNKNMFIAASSGIAGGFAGKILQRPPIYAGAFLAFAYLFKKALSNQSYRFSGLTSIQKFSNNALDFVLPFIYYKISDNQMFEDYDLDFCWPGTITAYFISQKVANIAEQILNPPPSAHRKKSFSLTNDLAYVICAGISGFLLARRRCSSAKIRNMMVLASLERGIMRSLSLLGETKQVQKICENLFQLALPLLVLIIDRSPSKRFIHTHWVTVNNYRIFKIVKEILLASTTLS